MDLSLVQRIRSAPQPQRLELLIEGLFGPGASNRSGLVMQVEQAMRLLGTYKMSVSAGHYMSIVTPDPAKKASRKVIITENEYGEVTKSEYEEGVSSFDFLKDYLGLGDKEPFTPDQMLAKYPFAKRLDGTADEQWYDAITRILIKGLHRQIVGPGKKSF